MSTKPEGPTGLSLELHLPWHSTAAVAERLSGCTKKTQETEQWKKKQTILEQIREAETEMQNHKRCWRCVRQCDKKVNKQQGVAELRDKSKIILLNIFCDTQYTTEPNIFPTTDDWCTESLKCLFLNWFFPLLGSDLKKCKVLYNYWGPWKLCSEQRRCFQGSRCLTSTTSFVWELRI